MGVRVSTVGADSLADTPALKRLVLRRRSSAAKERKEREAGMSLLCGPCVLSRLEIGSEGYGRQLRSAEENLWSVAELGLGAFEAGIFPEVPFGQSRDQSVFRPESVWSPSLTDSGRNTDCPAMAFSASSASLGFIPYGDIQRG